MKAWLWSLKCSLVYQGRSGWGAEDCQWGFVHHKWVMAMKQLGPAGWSSPLCLWPAKGLAAGESCRAKCFLISGQAGTDGGHGRRGTSSWRFYKGLLTIGFKLAWMTSEELGLCRLAAVNLAPCSFLKCQQDTQQLLHEKESVGCQLRLLCNPNASDQMHVQRWFEFGIIASSPPSMWDTNAQCRKFP